MPQQLYSTVTVVVLSAVCSVLFASHEKNQNSIFVICFTD